MSKNILIALLLCIFSGMASGQSKKAMRHFEDAREDIADEDFGDALEELADALEDSPDYVEALLLKADVHKKLGEDEKSLPLYEKAIQSGAPYYVLLFYGETLFHTANYAKAVEPLEAYINHPRANPRYSQDAREMVKSARFAAQAKQKPVEYNPQNLGPKVNTNFMEYFPSISADGQTLVFTHRKTEGESTDEDFWVTEMDTATGEWQKARPLRGFLNTRLNEGAQSISSNERTIFFAACDRPGGKGSCDIYASFDQGDGEWSRPINLGGQINSTLWESQPSISADGRTLYFVRGKNSFDKNIEIYYSTLSEDGRWSKAERIPGKVNTQQQETSPYIHFDNQSLYFSSNGHPGMGDLDFFVSRRQPDGSWGEPQNLGFPINTTGQEFSLIVAPDGKTGYFSSDALDGGMGMLDLYSFELPEETRAVEIAYIRGKVINKNTREPLSARIEFSDLENGKLVHQETSNRRGQYFSVLPGNTDYGLSIQKPGFLFYSKNFSLSTETADKAHVLNVELVPIEVGKTVKLENVFFEFDSYQLEEKSYSELNSLKEFLMENPEVKINIEGHTDSEGNTAYNKNLSENRAKSVYNYLVSKGIGEDRLSYEGFGDEQPVATNQTEEGRALNRRTEIKIVEA